MAAEPWARLSPRHLVGIRDEASGRLACAMVIARGRRQRALLLGLGPEAFERFSISWSKIAREWTPPKGCDGFVFSTLSRRAWENYRRPWARLGAWGGILLGACSFVPWSDLRPLRREEADFLARALRALARWGGSASSFLAPPPAFPVLSLAGREGLEVRESIESIEPPRLRPLPLQVRPEIRDAIPSVATVDAYFLHFPPAPGVEVEEPSRILVLYDHARGRLVAAKVLPQDGYEFRAGEVLLDALAGNLRSSPPPPRPWRIVTDSRPFCEHAREALESLGIRLFLERRLPSLRGRMSEVWNATGLDPTRELEDGPRPFRLE